MSNGGNVGEDGGREKGRRKSGEENSRWSSEVELVERKGYSRERVRTRTTGQ